jgi:hypothetical protein
MALVAGAAPAAVFAATDSKSKTASTTTTKPKTTTTTTKAKTTTTTSTTTTTTTTKPTLIGGTVVLDGTKSPIVPPTCAANSGCYVVLTRVTAIPTIRDGIAYPTKVKAAGSLVAFTLGLAKISKTATQTPHQIIAGLDASFGGTTQAAITVLKPGPGKNSTRFYSVVAQSTTFHLQPYLGYIVQFPLATPIPVVPGEVVALTIPTWAPVISYDLPLKSFAYRQSRKTNCPNTGHYDNAQLTIGQGTEYKCDYPGSRLEYNVTEITTPPPPANYVH